MGKAEILVEIKKAEEQVRAMALGAEEKRKQLQAEGKRKALEIVDAGEAASRADEETKLAKARTDIAARRKVLLDQGGSNARLLASTARGKMDSAKEFVLAEFERAADA